MSDCMEHIKKMGGKYCPGDFCVENQPLINQFCKQNNLPPATPFAAYEPNVGLCYCWCGGPDAAAAGMPVEAERGLYRLADTLRVGDRVLATGPSLSSWAPREVTHLGGIGPGAPDGCIVLGQFRLEGGDVRMLVAPADHLFLGAEPVGAALVPFSHLRPGHRVRAADGGAASVVLTSYVRFSGVVRHVALGSYEPGGPLDGHLVNTNGLVTADLSVQLAYVAGTLPATLAARGTPLPATGSAEFHAAYDTAAYAAFVRDPALWPPLCLPMADGLPGAQADDAGSLAPVFAPVF